MLRRLTPACKLSFSTGGLNECIEELKRLAVEQDVPVFFVMDRRRLGKAILRKVPVSVVGVMNFAGTDVSNVGILCGFSGSALHNSKLLFHRKTSRKWSNCDWN